MGVCSFKQRAAWQTERLQGCLQPEEGETQDILLLSRDDRDRQTDREERSAQTLAGEVSSFFPPYGEFSFSKRKYSLFFLAYIFLSNARLLALVRQGNLPQVEWTCQDKGGPAGLKSLNFVPKVAC